MVDYSYSEYDISILRTFGDKLSIIKSDSVGFHYLGIIKFM